MAEPPSASEFLHHLEELGIKYWAVIAHPAHAKIGISPSAAMQLIKKHHVHLETEHPAHNPQQRRFWRRLVASCNKDPDISRPVYAEGGSDFHHRGEGERLGWGLVTRERLRLSFNYLAAVGEYFAQPHQRAKAEFLERGDYNNALKSAGHVAQLLPLQQSSYQALAELLAKLAAEDVWLEREIQNLSFTLRGDYSRAEVLSCLQQIRPKQKQAEIIPLLEELISAETDPDVCIETLNVLRSLAAVNDKERVLNLLARPDTLPDVKIAALNLLSICADENDLERLWLLWREQQKNRELTLKEVDAEKEIKFSLQELLAKRAGASFFSNHLSDGKLKAVEAGLLLTALTNAAHPPEDQEHLRQFFNQHALELASRFRFLAVNIYDLACQLNNGSMPKILTGLHGINDQTLINALAPKEAVLAWPEINRHLNKEELLTTANALKKAESIAKFPLLAARERFQQGLNELAKGERISALALWQEAIKLNQNIAGEIFTCLDEWLAREDPVLARELLLYLPLEHQPEFWFLRAQLAFRFEDYEEVVKASQHYLRLNGERQAEIKRKLALALWRLGKKRRAKGVLADLLAADPDDKNNLLIAVEFDGRVDSSVFQHLQKLYPHEPVSLRLVSNHLLRTERWSETVLLLEHQLKFNARDRFLQINLAKGYESEGKEEESFKHWLAAYRLQPRQQFLQEKVRTALAADVFLARQHAGLAADLGLDLPEVSVSERVLASNQAQRDLLVKTSFLCVKAKCQAADWSWVYQACSLLEQENLLARTTKADYAISLLHVCRGALPMGLNGLSKDAAQRVLAVQPKSVYARHYLGAALAAEGRHKQAVKFCLEAWRLLPKSETMLQNLVQELALVGDAENAARFQAKLDRFSKDNQAVPGEDLPAITGPDFLASQQELAALIAQLDNATGDLSKVFAPLLTSSPADF